MFCFYANKQSTGATFLCFDENLYHLTPNYATGFCQDNITLLSFPIYVKDPIKTIVISIISNYQRKEVSYNKLLGCE